MLRKTARVAVCAAMSLLASSFALGVALAQDKKVPSIHDIMEEGHSGKKSLENVLKTSVKGEKWDDAAVPAKKLKEFGAALGQNKPEKGDEKSWKALTAKYAKSTAAVAEAVEKKDKAASTKALSTLRQTCKECHDVHQ